MFLKNKNGSSWVQDMLPREFLKIYILFGHFSAF